ncbi:MAG: sigma-70 family RNA polymerase sigma factor [Chloroflexi bacterium]|nr:sigma-70 family RNA polymerase sigma factor [Chloroflexota bacterium]
MPDEERALVQRATTHDPHAFAQLYDRYVARIYKYIYYRTGASMSVEDLTAQVFLKAWESIASYRWTERPFAAWLFRIAHNLIVDHYRQHREFVSIDDLTLPNGDAPGLDDLAHSHLNEDLLRQAIAKLTDDQQQVIILKFLEGYEVEQIADLLGKDERAIRSLQHRALATLQRILHKGKVEL